jgi:hypothetical protein
LRHVARLNFFSAKLRANFAKLRVQLDCFASTGTEGSAKDRRNRSDSIDGANRLS